MQRYLLSKEKIIEEKIIFTEEDLHHILHVMRFQVGDKVIVGDGQERAYLVELTSLSQKKGEGIILEPLYEERELPVKVTLAQGLAKGEKMDWIIQKATELGVFAILPFTSSRTIVKLDKTKAQERILRWQRIAKEAAEQCHRTHLPQILPPVPYEKLLQMAQGYDFSFIPYEKEGSRSLFPFVERIPVNRRILVVIGPEGGFSEEEVQRAEKAGIYPVSLGKRILRTETAAIVALSVFVHHYERSFNETEKG
ncbi:Ribosomal RNA small subunit methyltransferase E [[Clostridium] ultunense Esp]|nr:Ribosomal RNA small subunit methyltransferase E [[Clostridium] ultunense Esp]